MIYKEIINKNKLGKISLSTSIFLRITHEIRITNKRGERKYRKVDGRRTNRNEKLKANELMITN